MNNCLECKKLTGGLCKECFMNQTNNRIREEFWKKVIECSPEDIKNDTIKLVSDDNVEWLIAELLKSQKESLVEKIETLKEKFTGASANNDIHRCGYNDAIDDITNLIKESKNL